MYHGENVMMVIRRESDDVLVGLCVSTTGISYQNPEQIYSRLILQKVLDIVGIGNKKKIIR
jgi:hypothetical protein